MPELGRKIIVFMRYKLCFEVIYMLFMALTLKVKKKAFININLVMEKAFHACASTNFPFIFQFFPGKCIFLLPNLPTYIFFYLYTLIARSVTKSGKAGPS